MKDENRKQKLCRAAKQMKKHCWHSITIENQYPSIIRALCIIIIREC